jgi:hypothetical protein
MIMPETSEFSPEPTPEATKLAQEEAFHYGSGTLEEDGKQQDHTRRQKFRNHLNIATLAIFWVVVSLVIVGMIVYAFHILCPTAWHFLDAGQLGDLKSILATAILSSALTGYANKQMS